ncbi:MAG: MBOAT family protein [Undibacterium sp.]|nr:MBOAT family protein [Opitutaceae bacterium]
MRRPDEFGLFAIFFPALVAGPIERYGPFTASLRAGLDDVDWPDIAAGAQRIALGFAKKLLIADNLTQALNLYGPRFATLSFGEAWLFLVGLSARIFFDFSGYSDLAIGFARLMGVRPPDNFNWPYLATSLRDFWSRWHISLSSWIRDYVYIPLGGSGVVQPVVCSTASPPLPHAASGTDPLGTWCSGASGMGPVSPSKLPMQPCSAPRVPPSLAPSPAGPRSAGRPRCSSLRSFGCYSSTNLRPRPRWRRNSFSCADYDSSTPVPSRRASPWPRRGLRRRHRRRPSGRSLQQAVKFSAFPLPHRSAGRILSAVFDVGESRPRPLATRPDLGERRRQFHPLWCRPDRERTLDFATPGKPRPTLRRRKSRVRGRLSRRSRRPRRRGHAQTPHPDPLRGQLRPRPHRPPLRKHLCLLLLGRTL